MRWFKSQKQIDAEEEQAFRTDLAKKLEGYQSDGHISTFSATAAAPDHPYDGIDMPKGFGLDADPRWLEKPDQYIVEEVALADLSDADLEKVARLRETYSANLRAREVQADPDTKRFDALLRGEDVTFPNK